MLIILVMMCCGITQTATYRIIGNLENSRTVILIHRLIGLFLRDDGDYIQHRLVHDGLPYSSHTNLDMPNNLNASGLAYHTQIENDFLRFNIEDVPETSGRFCSAIPRIE